MSAPSLHQTGSTRSRVASEVRAQMARAHLTPAALARLTGRSQTYWWRRINSEETALDVDDLGAIASALDVDIADLVGRAEEGRRPDHVDDQDGGDVRHRRLERRTRWLMPDAWSEGHDEAQVLPFRQPGAEPGIAA